MHARLSLFTVQRYPPLRLFYVARRELLRHRDPRARIRSLWKFIFQRVHAPGSIVVLIYSTVSPARDSRLNAAWWTEAAFSIVSCWLDRFYWGQDLEN